MLDDKTLRESLDEDQYAAVTAPLGNILCIANAGSGKTRVLTYRIAHLIDVGEPESSFMMLTFTVKAAKEMMERIKTLLNKPKLQIMGGTFHSVAIKFIKKYAYLLGYKGKIITLDAQDSVGLMGVAREYYCAFHNVPAKELPSKKTIASLYSYSRNKRLDFKDYLDKKIEEAYESFSKDDFSVKARENGSFLAEQLVTIAEEYESRKRMLNAMDFDDLLIYFDKLLDFPVVRDFVHRTLPNVFVDEFQDINVIQDSIIHKLADGVNRLTAVGDDAQCIYGFRGSEVQFIQDFKESYPGASIFPIRNNYRSTDKIVNLALSVINGNPNGSQKEMTATQQSSYFPSYSTFCFEKEQADYIVQQVRDAHARGIPYSEMAILCRLNRLPRPIEVALNNAKIPVSMECGISFYERAHIRLALDLFKFVDNPKNQIAFWNLAETVEGIGPKTARNMFALFEDKKFDLGSLVSLKVPKKAQEGYSALVDAIIGTNGLLADPAALQTVRSDNESKLQTVFRLFKTNWLDSCMKKVYDGQDLKSRQKDLVTLYSALSDFDEVDDFLEIVALVGDREEDKASDKVRIMSIHKSKGLEWDKVFIPYMNDQILPHGRNDDYEEERRLCYVALTRGRKEVDMCRVMHIENMEYFRGDESPFLTGDARKNYRLEYETRPLQYA